MRLWGISFFKQGPDLLRFASVRLSIAEAVATVWSSLFGLTERAGILDDGQLVFDWGAGEKSSPCALGSGF